jgi:hypothetical protein
MHSLTKARHEGLLTEVRTAGTGNRRKPWFFDPSTEKLLMNWVFLGKGDGLSFQLIAFLQATFKTPNQFIHQLLIQILQEVIDFLLKFPFRVNTVNSDR